MGHIAAHFPRNLHWFSNQQEHAYDAHVVLDSSVVPCCG